MTKALCCLLLCVNYTLVGNYNVANMSFNFFHENKILTKISELTVCDNSHYIE